MNRSKRLLVIPCLSFFAGMLPNIAAAQNNAATALSTSFREPNGSKAVSAAELITVAGTIQQAISTNASGLPRDGLGYLDQQSRIPGSSRRPRI